MAAKVLDMVQHHVQEGDAPPDFDSQIVVFGRALKATIERLVAIDRDIFDENDKDGCCAGRASA